MTCDTIVSITYTTSDGLCGTQTICGKEMVEVGEINIDWNSDHDCCGSYLYQCPSCKSVKIV